MTASAVNWGVPSCDGTIHRASLVSGLLRDHRSLVVLAAPSGFGKTVTTAQLAAAHSGPVVWVSADGQPLDSAGILTLLGQVLERWVERPSLPRPDRMESPDYLSSIRSTLASLDAMNLWLVIDDAALGSGDMCGDVLRDLSARLSPFLSRVVITVRELDPCQLSGLPDALILDEHDLSLSIEEAIQMGDKYGGVESQLAVSASDAYCGHPALVRMAIALASSAGASRGGELGPRLAARALVERLVAAHLTADERETLEIASLFRQGNVADLEAVGVNNARRMLESICRQVPLVSLETSGHGHHVAFAVHDLVSECLAWSLSASLVSGRRLLAVAHALADQSKWGRAVSLLREFGTDVQLLDFVDSTGERMIEEHQAELILDVLNSVALSRIMSRPKSLLFWSQSLLEVGEVTESIAKAAASIRLAEHEGDFDTLGLAASQRMQALLDQCKAQEAIDSSERVRHAFLARMGPAVRGELLLSYGTALGVLERRGEALRAFSEAEAAVSSNPVHSARLLGRLRRTRAYLHALWDGDFSKGVRETSPLLEDPLNPRLVQEYLRGNLAWMLMETGRLERSEALLSDLLADPDNLLAASFLPVSAAVFAARGDSERSLCLLERSHAAAVASQDEVDLQVNRLYESCIRRSAGQHSHALDVAERSFEKLSEHNFLGFSRLAIVEIAASLLALGDSHGAEVWLGEETDRWFELNQYHALCAAAIRAVSSHRAADTSAAVDLLRPFADFIRRDNANWRLAMYSRSFPELLGLLGAAIGPERLPAHMLRMVLPEDAEQSLTAARGFMETEQWELLGRRILGDEQFAAFVARRGRPICRVKLFGGLEVRADQHLVKESDWKKRKARLLFAMLVVRQGQDVARDQILDYLWPDLTEAKAKNNFYVAWSTMKAALMRPDERGQECPYIESRRGRCRIVRESVRSDVDEFEELLAQVRSHEAEGQVGEVVSSLHQLMSVYRGDLLPGDVYDDWFAQLRDKYRFDFVDALVRGAELLLDNDEPGEALVLARRALAVDPYREDLYQIALRCQIMSGQRSAAIETFIECKTQLAEQLGLDPASETMRLYQQILAMEEAPRYDAYGLS